MGESPDRVLRDGERARERDRERPAGVREDGTGGADAADVSDGAGAAAEAVADSGSAAGADTDGAPAGASSPAGSSSADEAAGSSEGSSDAPSGTARAGSTVQLRVRDVDTRTTMLRLPVDNATTALRLPPEVTEPAPRSGEAAADGGAGGADDAPSAKGAAAAAPAGRPSGADPRLALRTSVVDRPERPGPEPAPGPGPASEGAPDTESEPEPEAAPDADSEPASERNSEPASEREKEEERGAEAAHAPARSEQAEKLEKPRAFRAPGSGTVPEPPAPRPLPEPGPVPEPVPEPHPEPKPVPEPEPTPGPEPLPKPDPKPGPRPAPSPLPTPDPQPVPPVPPLPKPEPLPAPEPLPVPETTAEAMEVLAALNSRPVSPLRRALKRITIWTVFLGVVLGAVVVAQLLRPLPDARVKLTAPGSFSFGGDPLDLAWPAKGQSAAEVVGVGSLGSSGTEAPASIASVTKVMNAYLILQAHPLKKGESGPKITVDKQAAQESGNVDESRVTLVEGQQISQYQALELLMLPSANNVARLLARWDSGSEDAFVKKMNDAAARFGMTNTTYTDPAGFSPDTKSTAKDQLKLAGQVMQDEVFRQIVSTPDTNFNNQKISNTNTLISPKNGIIGVKTGSSTPAGGCLMWAAYKEIGGVRRLILGVTLGQPATAAEPSILKVVQNVSAKQIQAAQNGLTGQTLAKQGDVVGQVDDGLGGTVPVIAAKELTTAGFPGISGTVSLDPAKLGHTAKAGTQVGVLRVGTGDGKVEVPVVLQSDLAPPSILSRLTRLL
ncbi:D-alanyl-D-alanine carboxypeptidase [Kitasatospora sp. A2-31]|uniref:D-alanyl-D-alanine carboxypeptidase n=1 Tax=Kitasatospora sp. A2-31 TaxID=2916414 RepID=UPI001EEDAB1B|nr:D-alanyl-D-alanine carboxypeptidase [Kitasatospora sp. A2-31]MCG6498993.1 D-alanyl-D-alanine carboxypeptidase [Kitasatospora sp. A2-31]